MIKELESMAKSPQVMGMIMSDISIFYEPISCCNAFLAEGSEYCKNSSISHAIFQNSNVTAVFFIQGGLKVSEISCFVSIQQNLTK